MTNSNEHYKTIVKATKEVLLKEKKSKFYGYAFPISQESEVKPLINELRKIHPTANHVCYAWQLGVANYRYRANDDGEPNNSAGMPIYGQIQSFQLTNLLVAVVRIFGGTKLGVGGLISAYKTTAQMTLDSATLVEKKLQTTFLINFPYSQTEKVMRIVKRNRLQIVSQKMELECALKIMVNSSKADVIQNTLIGLQEVRVQRSK